MEKPAVTQLTIHPLIKNRWSPRSFNPNKPIEQDKIERILEAPRWAPSAFNEQPWRFIIGIKGSDSWQKIYDSLVPFNQEWAANAHLLIVTMGKKTLSQNGNDNGTYTYDVGGSVAYITFQAMAEGLFSHQMGGFSKAGLTDSFQVPADFNVLTVTAIGYQDTPDKLGDDLRKRETSPRERHPQQDYVFYEKFGV